MFFGRKSEVEYTLEKMLGLRKGVAERDSLKSRDFSIISRRESILALCLAWIVAMAVATTNITTFIMDC